MVLRSVCSNPTGLICNLPVFVILINLKEKYSYLRVLNLHTLSVGLLVSEANRWGVQGEKVKGGRKLLLLCTGCLLLIFSNSLHYFKGELMKMYGCDATWGSGNWSKTTNENISLEHLPVYISDKWYLSGVSAGTDALYYLHQWYQQWDQVHFQHVCRWHQAMWCGSHTQATGFHPERPTQAQAVSPAEPYEVQQIEIQGLHLGCGNPCYQRKLGDERMEHSQNVLVDGKCALAAQKANCILGCIKGSMASMLRECSCPFTLSSETSSGMLCPDAEFSVQGRCRPLGAHPEEATKMIQGMEHLCFSMSDVKQEDSVLAPCASTHFLPEIPLGFLAVFSELSNSCFFSGGRVTVVCWALSCPLLHFIQSGWYSHGMKAGLAKACWGEEGQRSFLRWKE